MTITVEISYYPLTKDFEDPINTFIEEISKNNISIEVGRMSTIVNGEYEKIMSVLTESMGELMKHYPSIFNLRISNSCPVK